MYIYIYTDAKARVVGTGRDTSGEGPAENPHRTHGHKMCLRARRSRRCCTARGTTTS